jgi:hypothetical protein
MLTLTLIYEPGGRPECRTDTGPEETMMKDNDLTGGKLRPVREPRRLKPLPPGDGTGAPDRRPAVTENN